MSDDHKHEWGPVEHARFTDEPHRKCQVPGCKWVTLDLEDGEDRCPHGMFYSGAGACPQCGRGAD